MTRALRFVPALAWAALIFWLSSQPQLPDLPFGFDGMDKLIHAGFYGVLALLSSFGAGKPSWRWAIAAALYGLTDEIHQHFVPGRSADLLDLAADASGACLAVALWQKLALSKKGALDVGSV